ncbi:MAG: thiamine pyrophosphate-dependent enzyme [Candidatus Bipolaricaulota bacterium]|nr:thiamine pyrophosphate-dependent enzyme [Candidatus Bipolaricaulota bacterium]
MKRILTGNDAVALGALRAGVRVVTGYPGTPSTEALASLLVQDLPGRHVEWSTNEKVAFEIAAGAAWAGRRALVTMKMSGLNVAYDALVSIAYSGTNAGLVVYVADDPGVSAGMPEQDTRGFALMTDAPMLEPSSVEEAFRFTQTAFELSEAIGGLVFLRLTTAVALTHVALDVDQVLELPPADSVILERDTARYTKAGAAICLSQHRALLARLADAERFLHEQGVHQLRLGKKGGLGIAVVGAPAAYLDEALSAAGLAGDDVSVLRAASTIPFPTDEVERLLHHCGSILVLEELEPHFERQLLIEARRVGFAGRVVGKLDGTLSRSGEYGVQDVLHALVACSMWPVEGQHVARSTWPAGNPDSRQTTSHEPQAAPSDEVASHKPQATSCEQSAAPRPITVCSGCPHRGTYMAIEAAIRIKTPVIATIGDSTFFHGGIPGVLNAVQHRTPLVVVVMDNGWTGMTGMQVNAGTAESEQKGGRRVDLAELIPALGVDRFAMADPYDLAGMTAILTGFLQEPSGVRVLLARRECAIQARRRGAGAGAAGGAIHLDAAKCVLCKRCIQVTGCPALSLRSAGQLGSNREGASTGLRAGKIEARSGHEKSPSGDFSLAASIAVDEAACNGCGLCAAVCPTRALGCSPDGGCELLGSKPAAGGFDGRRGGRS